MEMNKKRRIGFLFPLLKLGGAERLVQDMIRLAPELDLPYEFLVLTLSLKHDQMSALLSNMGCEVVSLNIDMRFDFRAIGRIRSTIRELGLHLLHSHLPRTGILARLALGSQPLVPHVYTEHSLQMTYHPLTRLLNAYTLHWNTVNVAVSEATLLSMQKSSSHLRWAKTRLKLIPNGVDIQRLRNLAVNMPDIREQLGLGNNIFLIGLIGHFRPEKGHVTLLRALRELNSSDLPQVLTIFVGRDDGTEAAVRHQVQQLGLEQVVSFLGYRDYIPAILNALDILVMPSTKEGLPVTLLEAMALGKAVIATPAGGIPEVVKHEINGLLVPIGNHEALASAIRNALSSVEIRNALGQAARRTIEECYDVRKMIRAYAEVYASLIG